MKAKVLNKIFWQGDIDNRHIQSYKANISYDAPANTENHQFFGGKIETIRLNEIGFNNLELFKTYDFDFDSKGKLLGFTEVAK